MQNKRVCGMVLAAGLGTRLRPITDKIPKPAVLVGGKPLLHYALLNMKNAGVSRVVINTHYLAEQVVDVAKERTWPFELVFVHEPHILGTGGALRNAQKYFDGCDAILTYNSDAIVDFDCSQIINEHLEKRPLSTMLLKSVEDPDAFGAVVSDAEERVRDIIDLAGYQGQVTKRRMYCGVQVLSQEMFDWMPQAGTFCIVRQAVIPAIQKGAIVRGMECAGFFCDVGTIERLDFANRHLTRKA